MYSERNYQVKTSITSKTWEKNNLVDTACQNNNRHRLHLRVSIVFLTLTVVYITNMNSKTKNEYTQKMKGPISRLYVLYISSCEIEDGKIALEVVSFHV